MKASGWGRNGKLQALNKIVATRSTHRRVVKSALEPDVLERLRDEASKNARPLEAVVSRLVEQLEIQNNELRALGTKMKGPEKGRWAD